MTKEKPKKPTKIPALHRHPPRTPPNRDESPIEEWFRKRREKIENLKLAEAELREIREELQKHLGDKEDE